MCINKLVSPHSLNFFFLNILQVFKILGPNKLEIQGELKFKA